MVGPMTVCRLRAWRARFSNPYSSQWRGEAPSAPRLRATGSKIVHTRRWPGISADVIRQSAAPAAAPAAVRRAGADIVPINGELALPPAVRVLSRLERLRAPRMRPLRLRWGRARDRDGRRRGQRARSEGSRPRPHGAAAHTPRPAGARHVSPVAQDGLCISSRAVCPRWCASCGVSPGPCGGGRARAPLRGRPGSPSFPVIRRRGGRAP